MRNMIAHTRGTFILLVLSLFLASCGMMPAPQSMKQRLAIVDSQFTAVVKTAVDLRSQGLLSNNVQEKLTEVINNGNAALKAAWAADGVGDLSQAENQLRLVNSLLWQIKEMLPKEVPK